MIKIERNNIKITGLYSIEEGELFFARLERSLKSKDSAEIEVLLKDEKGIKTLIGIRGEKGNCLELVRDAILFLFAEKDLKLSLYNNKTSDWFRLFHEKELDEKIIDYLFRVSFHSRDKETIEFLKKIESQNKDSFKDENVYYWLLHGIASWDHVVENDYESSINRNIEVLKNMQGDSRDDVLYWKAKSGLAFSKSILPKLKIKDFLRAANELENLGDSLESFRNYVEAARAYLDLSKQQGVQVVGFKSLNEAEEIAENALKISKKIGYANLEIVANEILCDLYDEKVQKVRMLEMNTSTNNLLKKDKSELLQQHKSQLAEFKKKQQKCLESTNELREKYHYQTKFVRKYKENVFLHL